MAAPLIGLTTSASVGTTPERLHLNAAYVRAVEAAGGVPVLLAPYLTAHARAALWPRLDALVLTGGGDVDPARFGEAPHPRLADVSPERDALEYELIDRALADRTPVFGICRGLQVLNVALGGSLWQDVPERGGPVVHTQQAPRAQPTHAVKILGEGTRLGAIVGTAELDVNSFHHQAIKRLGHGLRETAWAADGVIEAIETEDADERFLLAVQWHPEDLVEHDAAARALFAAVVHAARERTARR